MRTLRSSLTVALAALSLAACSRGESERMDEGLRQDLSLASQMQPYAPQPYISPVEMGYDQYGRPIYQQSMYRNPAYPYGYPAPMPVATAPAPRVIYRSPAPARYPTEVVTQTNTKRDAIIGAAAGAAIGAATTRDRLKGAVIGAAAGGILGAVYGQKVDVKKIPR